MFEMKDEMTILFVFVFVLAVEEVACDGASSIERKSSFENNQHFELHVQTPFT